MYLNLFSVRIPEGTEVPGGYVEITHGSTYTLVLRNSRVTRCDAQVYIDNKHVGTWRIPAQTTIRLTRPANDNGRFTFYAAGTSEFKKAELDNVDRSQLGLIRVVFTPEVYPTRRIKPLINNFEIDSTDWTNNTFTTNVDWTYSDSNTSVSNYYTTRGTSSGQPMASPGGTGLSGKSDQEFSFAQPINLDHSQQTVIHLRLVEAHSDEPRPLTQFSTPVPPPV